MSSVRVSNAQAILSFHPNVVLLSRRRGLRVRRVTFPNTNPSGNPVELTFKMSRVQPLLTTTLIQAPFLLAWIITSFAPPQSIPTTAARLILLERKSHHITPLLKPSNDWFLTALWLEAEARCGYWGLYHLVPVTSLGSSLGLCPLVHSIPAILASLLFFKHVRHPPASGPLHWLFHLPYI